ncbi:hypothetical protein D3C77_641200 [compost metagenome]
MLLIGPHGTPTASNFAIQSSRRPSCMIAVSIPINSSRFVTRKRLVAKRGSSPSSGTPIARQYARYCDSLPVATIRWPSLAANT